MGRLRNALTTAATLAALMGAAGTAHAADGLYGLTSDQTLLRISSADPANSTRVAISGLGGARLVAIDTHPQTGVLFGVADGGDRLFEIDPLTGVATEHQHYGAYFSEAATVGMAISGFQGSTSPSLQLSAGDAAISTGLPGSGGSFGYSTAYATGDSGEGQEPAVSGLADDLLSTSWRLLGVDHRRNVVARFTATAGPGAGRALTTVGSLGVDVPEELGFAPSDSGALYLAYEQPARGFIPANSVLRRVDRLTGAATFVGTIRALATRTLPGGYVDVVGLAPARPRRA